jgi:ABC-type multidrug transport system fused ATPase/permease subunit
MVGSVDNEMEAKIHEIVEAEFQKCTVIAIMHWIDHIEHYNKVMVVEDVVVVEAGKQSVLATTNSPFTRTEQN